MALNLFGAQVPAGGDAFDPQGDMVEVADSLAGMVVIPVASTSDRAAKIAALGWTPTSSRPVYVHRADAPAGLRLEVTENGSTWRAVAAGPAWTNCSLASGWSVTNGSLAPQYRVIGDVVELRGTAHYAAGLGTAYVLMLNSMPPVATSIGDYPVLGGVGVSRLSNGASSAVAYLNPRSDGGIRVAASASVGTNTVITLDGVSYRTSA